MLLNGESILLLPGEVAPFRCRCGATYPSPPGATVSNCPSCKRENKAKGQAWKLVEISTSAV